MLELTGCMSPGSVRTTNQNASASVPKPEPQPIAAEAPVISDVASANVTTASAIINWNTNIPATSKVEYGPDVTYGSTATVDGPPGVHHQVNLNSLKGSTTYHFRVSSESTAGSNADSNDYSLLTPTPSSNGDVFYVDAAHGSDGNDGRSPGSAWQTIAKVNGSAFHPGDQVLFMNGQMWREQLVVSSSGTVGEAIRFGTYGTGQPAQVLGSVAKNSSADWSYESANLWFTTVAQVPKIVWRNSARLSQAGSKSGLTVDGMWFWDPTSSRVYVFSAGNPGGSGSAIEIAQRANCITAQDKSFVTIDGLACSFTNDTGISPTQRVGVSTDWTIRNCTLKGFWSQGIRAQGSEPHQLDRVAITGNSISDFGGSATGAGGSNAGISVTYSDGVAIASNSVELTDLPNDGWGFGIHYSHTTTTNANSSIHDNRISGALTTGSPGSAGILLEDAYFVDIYQNQVSSNTLMGIWFDESGRGIADGPSNNNVHHNLITPIGNYAERGIFLENSPNNRIYYNIVNASGADRFAKGIWVHSASGGSSSNSVIVNNTVVGGKVTAYNAIQLGWSGDSADTKSCTVRNNIMYSNVPASLLLVVDNPQHANKSAGHVIDSNLYFHPGSGPIFSWFGTVYETLVDARQASGTEAKGTQGDPMFVDLAAGNLRLMTNSPAAESGESLGSSFNKGFSSQGATFPYALVTQAGAGWSLGAFVF